MLHMGKVALTATLAMGLANAPGTAYAWHRDGVVRDRDDASAKWHGDLT